MKARRWLGAAFGLLLALGVVLVAAPAANAGTGTGCTPGIYYPNAGSCDGLDPAHSYDSATGSECSAGASTVHFDGAFGGTLELRWGPDCGTNWTRFTPANNDEYEIWVTRLSDGAWAGNGMYHGFFFANDAGNGAYSDQVYSPGPAAACVNDITAGGQVCYDQ